MRFVSFNMRGGGSAGHWEHLLTRLPADVTLVQETKDPAELGQDLILSPSLPTAVWAPVEHGKWGSAVLLSKAPRAVIDVPGYAGWVVGVETVVFDTTVRVFSVHVPRRGTTYVGEANLILDAIAAVSSGVDVLIGGDFNLTVGRRQSEETQQNRSGETAG